MQTILIVFHLFLSIGLVGLILIQHGKGADAGAAFGSGASATVFGASGSANFLSRTTAVMAVLFFLTSMALAWFAMQTAREQGLMIQEEQVQPLGSEVPMLEEPQAGAPAVPEMPAVNATAPEVPVVPVTEEPVTEVPEVPAVAVPESDIPAVRE